MGVKRAKVNRQVSHELLNFNHQHTVRATYLTHLILLHFTIQTIMVSNTNSAIARRAILPLSVPAACPHNVTLWHRPSVIDSVMLMAHLRPIHT